MDKKLKALLLKNSGKKPKKNKTKVVVDDPLDSLDLSEAEQKELDRAAQLDSVSNREVVPSNREPLKKVDVECRICGKKEKVHPALNPRTPREKGEDFNPYVCNRCSGGG